MDSETDHSGPSCLSLDGHSEITFSRRREHDSNTSSTTTISAHNQSCPLGVCPKYTPTWAAVWDPEYGMVAIRETEWFEFCSSQNTITSREPLPVANSLANDVDDHRTSTFAFYQDVLKDSFQPTIKPPQRFHTMASSTLGGLDLYTHDSILAADRKSIGHFSCLDQLNDELGFDIRLVFSLEHSLEVEGHSITDEGFFDEGPEKEQILHLKSRFSTTTTSTSNYVEVARFSDVVSMASPWSTLEAPGEYGSSNAFTRTPRRRLRKRRMCDGSISPSPNHVEKTKYTNLIHRLPSISKFRKQSSLDEGWVCVEVTQTVTQRLL